MHWQTGLSRLNLYLVASRNKASGYPETSFSFSCSGFSAADTSPYRKRPFPRSGKSSASARSPPRVPRTSPATWKSHFRRRMPMVAICVAPPFLLTHLRRAFLLVYISILLQPDALNGIYLSMKASWRTDPSNHAMEPTANRPYAQIFTQMNTTHNSCGGSSWSLAFPLRPHCWEASAPNPKFAHSVRQIRSRTSGSRGTSSV